MNIFIIVSFVVLFFVIISIGSYFIEKINKIEETIKSFAPQIINGKSFDKGVQETLSVLQLSVFKMWQDNDILDFENFSNRMIQNFDHFVKNQGEWVKWNDKFQNYVKEKIENDEMGLK